MSEVAQHIWRGGNLVTLAACIYLSLTPVWLVEPEAAEAEKASPILFGGPFELIDHHGAIRTDAEFRGRFMLIYFGYTNCPDICPHNLQVMTEALEDLGEDAERIQPLFITSDPARDTPDLLREYVGHFHPSLIGLSGSEAQIRSAVKAYRVHRSKLVSKKATGCANDYLVNHTSITFLMHPDGEFATLFPHDTKPEFMTATIRRYLEQN